MQARIRATFASPGTLDAEKIVALEGDAEFVKSVVGRNDCHHDC